MPNHCSGHLLVTGKPKLLNKFMKQVEITPSEADKYNEATKFSLNKVIPMPEELHKGDGWYDWRISHWGTKWDLCDLEVQDSDWENGAIAYSFWTAWSPPEQVLQALTEQHPKLTFTYKFSDEGMGFWGLWVFSEGSKDVVEEGDGMTDEITCRVMEEFFGHGTDHHRCRECDEWYLECKGEDVPKTAYLCEECQTSLESLEKNLWESEDGTQGTDPNAKESEGSCQQLQNT